MREKHHLLLTAVFLGLAFGASAQVSVHDGTGTDPNASAMLDVQADDSGVLIPRMTEAQRNAIASPATSLLIYQTNSTPGYYYNSGTPGSPVWERLALTSGTVSGTGVATRVAFWNTDNSLGSSANLYWDNTNSRLSLGTSAPATPPITAERLHVDGNIRVTGSSNRFWGFGTDNHRMAQLYGYTSFNDFNVTSMADIHNGDALADSPTGAGVAGSLLNVMSHGSSLTQYFVSRDDARFWIRDGYNGWGPWRRVVTDDGAGSVGIGTETPQAQLHTTGTVRLSNFSNGFLQVDGNGNVSSIGTIPSGSMDEADPTWAGTANATGAVGRTGNVGVGVNVPEARLDVRGETHLNVMAGHQVEGVVRIGRTDGTPRYHLLRAYNSSTQANNYLTLAVHEGTHPDGTLDVMTLRGNGQVGIGTPSPAARLDIAATGNGTKLLRFNTERQWAFEQGNTGSAAELILRSEVNSKWFRVENSTAGERSLSVLVTTVPGSRRVNLVEGGGRVGIGTDNPQAQFHTTESVRFGALTNGFLVANATGDLSTVANPIPAANIVEADPTWSGTANTTGAVGRTGNVGIGIASPIVRLDVRGGDVLVRDDAAGAAVQIQLQRNDGTNNFARLKLGPFTDGFTNSIGARDVAITTRHSGTTGSNNIAQRWYDNGGTTVYDRGNATLHVTSNGTRRVGIGTISPTYDLHVNGRIRSNAINETSDARLKKNVTDLNDPLAKVLAMRGVNYEWRTDEFPEMDFDTTLQFGLIAQELEKVVPELVHTDSEGWKSIEYSHIVPLLIEAVKEQQATIDRQRAVIETQSTVTERLSARLAEQEQRHIDALRDSERRLTAIEGILKHVPGIPLTENSHP